MKKIPIYDIECSKCKEVEEVYLKIDEDLPVCPTCGGNRIKLCNCSHFKLVYNNKTDICSWGNEGYATSQYHRYSKG